MRVPGILTAVLLFSSAASGSNPVSPDEIEPSASCASAGASQIREGGVQLLWDQLDFASGNGAPSQDFETSYNSLDCEAADDFVLGWGADWEITSVVLEGVQQIGLPDSADLWIYPDDGGKPAASAACTYLDLGVAADPWNITLPQSCLLTGGVYWLSVQANQPIQTQGQHFWRNRAVRTGYESVWRNPANGFATGCTDWTPQRSCGVGGGASPDLLFQIYGYPADRLVDERNHQSQYGVLDQQFEWGSEASDSQAADDFIVVSKGGWLVRNVQTVGLQSFGGSPSSVDVRIYPDDQGYPFPIPTCDYAGLATAAPASLDVDLPAPCRLDVGTWWVEVEANQPSGDGYHFWIQRTKQTGSVAKWRNPLDGWKTGCTDWGSFADCTGASDPDLLFALEGLPILVFEDDFEIETADRWTNCSGCS